MLSDLVKSKSFILIAILLLALVSVVLSKELRRKYEVSREIKKLEQDIAQFEQKNQDVLELINYLKTPEYRERQARSLLKLQKPGEFAVALLPANEETPAQEEGGAKNGGSNFGKWWNYFFKRAD